MILYCKHFTPCITHEAASEAGDTGSVAGNEGAAPLKQLTDPSLSDV